MKRFAIIDYHPSFGKSGGFVKEAPLTPKERSIFFEGDLSRDETTCYRKSLLVLILYIFEHKDKRQEVRTAYRLFQEAFKYSQKRGQFIPSVYEFESYVDELEECIRAGEWKEFEEDKEIQEEIKNKDTTVYFTLPKNLQ